jgi:leucyl aminopeptidase
VLLFPNDSEAALAATAEGASLGVYSYTAQKSSVPDASEPLQEVAISTPLKPSKQLTAVLTRAAVVARHTKHVRDLVNTPANVLYPASFVDHAKAQAKGLNVDITVWDEKKLESEGFGGILGVGRGSKRPPRLVKVEYSPRGAKKELALVGKGITFDTGGISLKPPASMEEMKSDMAGAATVLHAALAAAELGLKVKVTSWLCLAENMPGGGATRPGDVLRMYNGKTVEVTNTDAEGRLVMADGLSKASESEPDLLYDIATLTGAQVVSLGLRTAGLMGDDEAVAALSAASSATAEPFWAMPFPEEIREDLDSATADLRNSGNRNGGMLKAGIFLSEFVASHESRAKAWGHLDVAGPAFNTGAPWGFTPKEGTGFGLRTLVAVADALA